MLGMIWAQGHGRAIGRGGGMAWNVPEDFRFFKRMTLGHPVIMGRRTWESLGEKYQPLPDRQNIVVSRNSGFKAEGADVARSLDEAIARAEPTDPDSLIWIMGGAQIYEAALPLASVLSVTDLDYEVPEADAFAPDFAFSSGNENEWLLRESSPDRGWHTSVSGIDYRFSLYVRAGTAVSDSVSLKQAL